MRQANGELSGVYSEWRRQLLGSLAHTEAFLDFGEDGEIADQARAPAWPG